MPRIATVYREALLARIHLYEIAYWSLVISIEASLLSPGYRPGDLQALLFIASALCLAMCVHCTLGEDAPPSSAPRTARPYLTPVQSESEQVLRVELERARRTSGPFAVLLLEVSGGVPVFPGRPASDAAAAADKLLQRYLPLKCSVLRLQGDRIAAVMPGDDVFEVDRLIDRLQEDIRGWTRTSPGIEANVGVVIDRGASVPITAVIRDLNTAVNRAYLSGRGRFVITEK